jgi:hypothetical protein
VAVAEITPTGTNPPRAAFGAMAFSGYVGICKSAYATNYKTYALISIFLVAARPESA